MSNVVGGGRPGEAGAGGCSAGVAEPVGGSEARADAGAWGVAAPDMISVAEARGVVIVEMGKAWCWCGRRALVRRAAQISGLVIGCVQRWCRRAAAARAQACEWAAETWALILQRR